MTIMNSITVSPIPSDLLVNLAKSIDSVRELSELTPVNDPNHRLLELVSEDCRNSYMALVDHFKS